MAYVRYTDDAFTTLASPLGTTDTSIAVSSSARFSGLLAAAGDYFFVTFRQSATGKKETVKVTAMSGNIWTVTRAVGPNDSALAFSAGDSVTLRIGTNLLTEIRTAQNVTATNFAVATGSGDVIVASLDTPPLVLVDGMLVYIRVPTTNTVAEPLFTLNAFPALRVKKDGGPLAAGGMPYEAIFQYSAAPPHWELVNQNTVTAVSVVSANGFAGSSGGGQTPQLTLTTTVSGILKGVSGSIAGCSDGNEYLSPTTGVTVSQASAQSIGSTGHRLTKLWATDITCTNPIAASVTGSSSSCTGNAATVTGLSLTSGKTLAVANSMTLQGMDGVVVTMPSVDATVATLGAQTFSGTQTFAAHAVFDSQVVNSITNVSSNYAVVDTDLVIVTATSGITISLPTAVGCTGRRLTILTINTSSITISAYASEKINASASISVGVGGYGGADLISTGAGWLVVSNR